MDINKSQEELQNRIDDLLKSSTGMEWTAPLPFHVEKVVAQTGCELLSQPGQCPDILMYLEGKFRGCKVYFSPLKYNPSSGFTLRKNKTKSPSDWDQLRLDLSLATIENGGFHLISNGSAHGDSRQLICQHARCYQKNKSYNGPGRQSNVDEMYRDSSFINDRGKNSRGSNGNKMARRTNTGRPVLGSSVCHFRLTIKHDAEGFYLQSTGPRRPHHCNHLPLDREQKPTKSRLIPAEIIETIRTLNTVHACAGIGRDVALKKHNTLLSLQQLRYLHGFLATDICSDDCAKPNLDGTTTTTTSSADRLIAQLCGSGNNHVCILQHRTNSTNLPEEDEETGASQQEPLQECYKNDNHGSLVDAYISTDEGKLISDHDNNKSSEITLDIGEYQEMTTFAKEKRNAHNCTDAQQLMIGVAWVSQTAKRWFKLFPHVLFIDVTEDTNKESRPFLTISVKDSSGHHHVVLRAFLPNQRAWSFRWIFQSVMPKLLGTYHLARVNMCLTDGDSQETSQLDGAIRKYFPQARRRRCAYHMITRRWDSSAIKKRVPEGLSCGKTDRSLVMKLLRDWQYTWTDSHTETASEMKVSVSLFLHYITSSDTFSKYATKQDVEEIMKITRESILPYEEYFSFYRFSDLRCYDARTTSGHEGTNLGLKRGATSMRPNQTLETAAGIVQQKERHHDAHAKVQNTGEHIRIKLWSNSETSKKLITMAESLLLQQRRLAESGDLLCAKVLPSNTMDNAVFHVAKNRCCEKERGSCNSLGTLPAGDEHGCFPSIPRFHRVRIVSVVGGRMLCTCRYFERFGVPCRHMIRVMLYVNPKHQITHHDISVVYWSLYPVFAYNEDCSRSDNHTSLLSGTLAALSEVDICGPKFPLIESENVSMCDLMQLPEDLVPRDAVDSVLNWTRTEMKRALRDNNAQQPQYEEVILSQDGSVCTGNINESDEEAMDYLTTCGKNVTTSFNVSDRKDGSSYQQVIPYVKDVVKRIDNGGFHPEMTPMLMEAIRAIELKLHKREAEVVGDSIPAGNLVSCHVPTHKRRKTSHSSRWGSRNS